MTIPQRQGNSIRSEEWQIYIPYYKAALQIEVDEDFYLVPDSGMKVEGVPFFDWEEVELAIKSAKSELKLPGKGEFTQLVHSNGMFVEFEFGIKPTRQQLEAIKTKTIKIIDRELKHQVKQYLDAFEG